MSIRLPDSGVACPPQEWPARLWRGEMSDFLSGFIT